MPETHKKNASAQPSAMSSTDESPDEQAHPARSEDDDKSDQRLGERIRSLRKRAGLSLKELSEKTSVSTGMISQIERGLSTPSLRSLRVLSMALKVPVSRFFEEREQALATRFVVRFEERRKLKLTQNGMLKHLITPEEPGQLELYEIELEPGATSGVGYLNARGEKAGYVVSGQLSVWIDEERVDLRTGDTFRLPASIPHHFKNSSAETARLIWITALPV